MEFYDEGFKAAAIVTAGFSTGKMRGRPADGGFSLPWLAQVAIAGGSGDHLEIGSLYGASALTAALAKRLCGLDGKVYCIDPWEPRDGSVTALTQKIQDDLSAKIEDVIFNIGVINDSLEEQGIKPVEIELIKAKSQPFPKELDNHHFVTSYIDGFHYDDYPLLDFRECAKRTEYFIAFDNYEETYPEILLAVHENVSRLNGKEPKWSILFKNGVFIALRKWQPPRNIRMATTMVHY